jgi:cytochrome c-type biogenesis protein CcmH/NrfG
MFVTNAGHDQPMADQSERLTSNLQLNSSLPRGWVILGAALVSWLAFATVLYFVNLAWTTIF